MPACVIFVPVCIIKYRSLPVTSFPQNIRAPSLETPSSSSLKPIAPLITPSKLPTLLPSAPPPPTWSPPRLLLPLFSFLDPQPTASQPPQTPLSFSRSRTLISQTALCSGYLFRRCGGRNGGGGLRIGEKTGDAVDELRSYRYERGDVQGSSH